MPCDAGARGERERFDELLADARGCTAFVTTTTASASSGRSGSSVVACSRRDGGSSAANALHEVDDLFDATPDEIGALLQR